MKNEREFKQLIKKSVKHYKGVYLALAAPMLAGLPDSYISMPPYIPLLVEMKWLGEVNNIFKRTIRFTPMQKFFIEQCHNISPYSAMGLIGFIYNKEIYCALVAHNTPLFTVFNNSFLTDCAYVCKDRSVRLFNVLELFSKVPIPKIKYQVEAPKSTDNDTTGSERALAV